MFCQKLSLRLIRGNLLFYHILLFMGTFLRAFVPPPVLTHLLTSNLIAPHLQIEGCVLKWSDIGVCVDGGTWGSITVCM